MNRVVGESGQDNEARLALWRAICVAAGDIRHQFNIKAIGENKTTVKK